MGRVTHRDTQMMLAYLLSQRENVAKYWVTVTAEQTHTIQSLGVSAATVVDWGDGLSNEYTGTAKRTHVYASAGTYAVKIYTPENVTELDLRDNKISVLNSADVAIMANCAYFRLIDIPTAGTINSADFAAWASLTIFHMQNCANITGSINCSIFAGKNMTNVQMRNCPQMYATVPAGAFDAAKALGNLYLFNCHLSQASADNALRSVYTATSTGRTVTGGTIYISGTTNAAPSGTFQPCQSPPVSASTPGKEIAYELLNDSLGVGFNKWATVNTN